MSVRIINTTGGTSRFGLIRQSSDFPTAAYSVCFSVYYSSDRTSMFQTPCSIAYDNGGGFNATPRYWCMADGSGAISHNFMMSSDGDDTYGADAPAAGRWYRMGLVLFDLGGGSKEHRFYYDLPTLAKVVTRPVTNQSAWDALTYMVIGAVPYTDFEGINGLVANFKVFNIALTTQQLIDETKGSEIQTGGLSGNLWAQLPLVSNANDISGNGRNFALTSGATGSDVFFDGTPVSFDAGMDKMGVSGELSRRKLGRTL